MRRVGVRVAPRQPPPWWSGATWMMPPAEPAPEPTPEPGPEPGPDDASDMPPEDVGDLASELAPAGERRRDTWFRRGRRIVVTGV